MRQAVQLLRCEARARIFFAALAQSSIGTGAAYVALLLIAYERFESPWAIGLVLLADVAPAMLLGPVFGAAADRWSRRACAVTADLIRAGAFAGILLVDGFAATVLLALIAGVGTGLFTPAALASLPGLVEERRLPAATSLYGALLDVGFIAGPGVAALLLLAGGPEAILAANAVTFAISAGLLAPLRFGASSGSKGRRPSLLREARDGMVATARMRGLRLVLLASGAALFCGALFNVGVLLLVTEELGSSDPGFSALVTLYGVGFIAGSLSGSKGGGLHVLKRRYLLGAFLMAAGFLASGLAPVVASAIVTFLAAGYGNGLLLVYERLLIQALVPDALAGRVFGVKDALTAWAFALGFLGGPLLLALLGTRPMVVAAGAGGLLVWAVSAFGLRRLWHASEPVAETPALAGGSGAQLAWSARSGEQGSDLVRS